MSREDSWAVRTVRNGRVKIGGVVFECLNARPGYNGKYPADSTTLEGQRFAFGRYRRYHDDDSPYYAPFVCLWGTERDFRSNGEMPDWGKPPLSVDGVFVFMWWEPVKEDQDGTE